MHHHQWAAAAAIVMALAAASAQAQTTTFPEGAEPLTAQALQAAVSDKVFAVTPAQGTTWRWQFKASGDFYLAVGSKSDNGKWHVQDSKLCQESVKSKSGCNEVRSKDGVLYLQRSSGEVVRLQEN